MPAKIPDRKTTQLRINKSLYYKAKVIGERESRNTNSQIEYFVRKGIEAYERDNGSIEVPDVIDV